MTRFFRRTETPCPEAVPNTTEMTRSEDTSAHRRARNHRLQHLPRVHGKEGVVGSSPAEGS